MTQANGKRLILASAGLLILAGLPGCAKAPPEEATNEVESNVASDSNTAAPAPVVQVPVENAAENVAAADPLPAEKPVPVDQQTLDDASATGMTSHVARDQDPGSAPAQ
jgi:hypothetical protein